MEYQIIILPLIAATLSQILKLWFRSGFKKFNLKDLVAYSGMPSGHSALVVSLVTIIALNEGIQSPIFAISFVFAILIIRDAIGLRKYLGEHGRALNYLVKDLKDDRLLEHRYPEFLENIGHTPLQVIIGSLIGFFISIIGYFILN